MANGDISEDSATPDFAWRRTNAPVASSRTDDIWFIDENTGWAVNSNGQILKTENGGATWSEQLQGSMYWRCISFANESVGWAGSLTANNRLYGTRNGGKTWSRVTNLPDIPAKICGLTVLDENTVIGSGTNEPGDTAAVVISHDAGATWIVRDMSEFATLLVDNYFVDANRGWVVGGKADRPNPAREDVLPVVLFTEDGGGTWRNVVEDIADTLRVGEWGWKIQFLDDQIGFVSMEAFDWAAILRTDDGARSWVRHEINDSQQNANIEGIGFIDSNTGWVGGWGDRKFQRGATSATLDSGRNWSDANEVGRFLNRFRFIGSPLRVGYASGLTVYKYSRDPLPEPLTPAEGQLLQNNDPMEVAGGLELPIVIPHGTRRIRVDVWDRFGTYVWSLLDDFGPEPGARTVKWDFRVWLGRLLDPGILIIRVTADGVAESQLVRFLGADDSGGGGGDDVAESYADVVAILDESIGGSNQPVGAHGAFWRNMDRDAFVAATIFGVKLITPNDGAGSGLVKALRGQTPFGSDSGNPDGQFRRMPAGRAPVAEDTIAAIERWIDNGAPA